MDGDSGVHRGSDFIRFAQTGAHLRKFFGLLRRRFAPRLS
jgi:hypothetical protein